MLFIFSNYETGLVVRYRSLDMLQYTPSIPQKWTDDTRKWAHGAQLSGAMERRWEAFHSFWMKIAWSSSILKMFGTFGSTTSSIGAKMPLNMGLGTLQNPMKDIEVASPPDDSVSALKFSPKANFFIASSWSNDVCVLFYPLFL